MSAKEKKKLEPGVLIAIIGLAGTLVAAVLSSPLLIKLIERTPVPATEETAPPTPVPPPGNPTLVFNEDFEDGRADGFAALNGQWQVRKTGGNSYFVSSGRSETVFGPAGFGDGTVSFEARFPANEGAYLTFRESDQAEYHLGLYAGEGYINLAYASAADNWMPAPFAQSDFVFEKNAWYHVQITLTGPDMKVWVNDALILQAQDERLVQGELRFLLEEGQSANFDNVAVWSAGD